MGAPCRSGRKWGTRVEAAASRALCISPNPCNDIARCARNRLRPHGWLLLEHGYDQVQPAIRLLHSCGYESVQDYPDDAGRGRVVAGRAP